MNLIPSIENFLQGKIEHKELGKELEKGASGIITDRMTKDDKIQILQKLAALLPLLPPEIYSEYANSFFTLGFNISDRYIYKTLKQYDSHFEDAKQLNSPNNICLFIFSKLLQPENDFYLLYWLDHHLANVKFIDQKFVLLEMYLKLLHNISAKEKAFTTILPNMLKALSDGILLIVTYFEKIIAKEQMDQNTHLYYLSFQDWILDLIKRILLELKDVKDLKNIRQLLTVNDIVEQNDKLEIVRKMENSNLAMKHYIVVFQLNLLECLIEASSKETQGDIMHEFYKFAKKNLLETCNCSPQELVDNFVSQFQFEGLSEYDTKSKVTSQYSVFSLYNVVPITEFCLDLLQTPSFNLISTPTYRLNLLIPIFMFYFRKEKAIQDVKDKIIKYLCLNLEQLMKQLNKKLPNLNWFNVNIADFFILLSNDSFYKQRDDVKKHSYSFMDCFEDQAKLIILHELAKQEKGYPFYVDYYLQQLDYKCENLEDQQLAKSETFIDFLKQPFEELVPIDFVDRTDQINGYVQLINLVLQKIEEKKAENFLDNHLLNQKNKEQTFRTDLLNIINKIKSVLPDGQKQLFKQIDSIMKKKEENEDTRDMDGKVVTIKKMDKILVELVEKIQNL